MPSKQSVVLTDRATTPVNHTFTPISEIPDGVVTAKLTGVPVGDPRFSVTSRRTPERVHGELRLTIPVVQTQTVNGVSSPVVVRTSYVTLKTSFAKDSSEQERNDAIGMIASALQTGKVLVNDALVKAEGVW